MFVPYTAYRETHIRHLACWNQPICTFLNFDIFVHGPHHRHPRVSHDQLEQLTRQYAAENTSGDLPIYPTYTSAAREMAPWMFVNPGVGMNVGAAPPASHGVQIDDFVADVTEVSQRGLQPLPKRHEQQQKVAKSAKPEGHRF